MRSHKASSTHSHGKQEKKAREDGKEDGKLEDDHDELWEHGVSQAIGIFEI